MSAPMTDAPTPGADAVKPDKPISFKAPMVRALLDGRKTQTRRVLSRNWPVLGTSWKGKKWPWSGLDFERAWARNWPGDAHLAVPFEHPQDGNVADVSIDDACIYRVRPPFDIGDRLWVKESGAIAASGLAFQHYVGNEASMDGRPRNPCWPRSPDGTLYKPRTSMFCPRWASRLTLVVTNVRVQRLQEISKADVMAEGIDEREGQPLEGVVRGWHEPFAQLWNTINGHKPEARWDANPWIVAVSFTVHRHNIDQEPSP